MTKLCERKGFLFACLILSLALFTSAADLSAAGKSKRKPISNPKFDPTAPQVGVFEAMEEGQVESRLVMKNPREGRLFVTNNTTQPLTVAMPDAMVGVHVLNQFGGQGGGGLGGGGGGGGQTGGGGVGGGGGGFGGGGGGGQGGAFFSIPADQTIALPFNSVCLEHGKKDPNKKMTYTIAPLNEFSTDPALKALLTQVSDKKLDPQVAQAIAWHVTDKMSWKELAAKSNKSLTGGAPTPYFSRAQLRQAQSLFASISYQARKAAQSEDEETERKNYEE